jgi:hypothetical protein
MIENMISCKKCFPVFVWFVVYFVYRVYIVKWEMTRCSWMWVEKALDEALWRPILRYESNICLYVLRHIMKSLSQASQCPSKHKPLLCDIQSLLWCSEFFFPFQNTLKWFTVKWSKYFVTFSPSSGVQNSLFPSKTHWSDLLLSKVKMHTFFLKAGEFWRSVRIPESTAVIILDLCVFPHRDYVYGGLWWCLLPDCPRTYVPCIFPPCRLGEYSRLLIFLYYYLF